MPRHSVNKRASATLTGCLLLAGTVLSCSKPALGYDLFVVPSDSVHADVRKIALVPTVVTDDVPVPEWVQVAVDSLIEEKVEGAGFAVVPAFVYTEIWHRISEEAGGFYDPFTGALDRERLDAAIEKLRQEFRDKYAPDAWLYPEFWVVEAEIERGFARWDGVSERVSRFFDSPVQALSLVVTLEDTAGAALYVNGGGITVLDGWAGDWTGYIVARSANQLFEDPEKLIKAVQLSLDPLVGGPEPTGR